MNIKYNYGWFFLLVSIIILYFFILAKTSKFKFRTAISYLLSIQRRCKILRGTCYN